MASVIALDTGTEDNVSIHTLWIDVGAGYDEVIDTSTASQSSGELYDVIMGSSSGDPGTAVKIDNGDWHIYNNRLHADTTVIDLIDDAGDGSYVHGNIIDNATTGIDITAGCTAIIGANKYLTLTTPIVDAEASTKYTDMATITWTIAGTIGTGAGVSRMRIPNEHFIIGAATAINTAPTGASLIVDVNLDGTSIYPTATKPTIAIGANDSGLHVPDTRTMTAAAHYLTVDVDQVGSTEAGADLSIFVYVLDVDETA